MDRLGIAVGIIALAAGALVASVVLSYTSIKQETILVTREPERQCKTSSDSEGNVSTACNWLIYTPNEVFVNEDNLLMLKFNSADVANRLNPGIVYCAKVNWFRIPFMSSFRNVIKATPGACIN